MEHYHQSSYRRSGRHKQKPASEWPHILLFYILPFLVFNAIVFYLVTAKPKFELTVEDTSDYQTTTATLTMKSWLPTKSIVMELDGENLELTKGKKRTYTTTLHRNGSLQAIVTNFNGMPEDNIKYVNILDDTPPTFSASYVEDGVLTVTLTDSQAGINYDSVYALNSTGERVLPLVANRDLNTFSFTMDSAGLRIFVQDMAAHQSRRQKNAVRKPLLLPLKPHRPLLKAVKRKAHLQKNLHQKQKLPSSKSCIWSGFTFRCRCCF